MTPDTDDKNLGPFARAVERGKRALETLTAPSARAVVERTTRRRSGDVIQRALDAYFNERPPLRGHTKLTVPPITDLTSRAVEGLERELRITRQRLAEAQADVQQRQRLVQAEREGFAAAVARGDTSPSAAALRTAENALRDAEHRVAALTDAVAAAEKAHAAAVASAPDAAERARMVADMCENVARVDGSLIATLLAADELLDEMTTARLRFGGTPRELDFATEALERIAQHAHSWLGVVGLRRWRS
jgi:hypothetical protein